MSKAERKLDGKIHLEVQHRGSSAYIPEGCPHRVRYLTPLGGLHLMSLAKTLIDQAADELGIAHFDGTPSFANVEDKFVLEVAQALDRELLNGNPHGDIFAQTYAKVLAAHIVTRYGHVRAKRGKLPALNPSKLRQLDQYIESMLANSINLSELAEQVGLSEFYFCHVFKETTGMSPYQYVLQKRIEFARTCLQKNDSSIQEIAFAAGFGDPVQFTKQFKRINGMPPSEYRANHMKHARTLVGF